MADLSPELRAALDVAKERIKVDSYFSKAHKASVQGRTQGLWAGTTLGLLSGGMIGGVLSMGLLLAHVATPVLVGLIGWPLVLGVAGIGAAMGGASGMLIGAPAGAGSGIMAEKERRERAEKLEQEVLASPDKQREVIEAYRKDPVVEKDTTVRETLATYKDKGKAWGKIIDLKTMGMTASICALFSATICAGAFLLGGGVPVVIGYGLTAHTWIGAALIGSALGAGTGSLFGFNFPILFSSLCEKAGDLLGGKMVRGKTGYPAVQTAVEQQQEAVRNRAASAPEVAEPSHMRVAASEAPSTRIHEAVAAAERAAPLDRQVGA